MNEIRIHNKPGRCELTVIIGDRFQSVSIKKTADQHDVANSLREWAANIDRGYHLEGMGSRLKDEPALDPSCCGNCSQWEYAHVEEGHGWCRVSTGSAHKNDVPCTYYQRKDI